MKKTIILLIWIWLVFPLLVLAQSETADTPPAKPVNVGKIFFPVSFIHGEKEYSKGIYRISFMENEGVPFFRVSNDKDEVLFEEMAISVFLKKRSGARGVHRSMVSGNEYFRIKWIQPDRILLAYFLVKPPAAATPDQQS